MKMNQANLYQQIQRNEKAFNPTLQTLHVTSTADKPQRTARWIVPWESEDTIRMRRRRGAHRTPEFVRNFSNNKVLIKADGLIAVAILHVVSHANEISMNGWTTSHFQQFWKLIICFH